MKTEEIIEQLRSPLNFVAVSPDVYPVIVAAARRLQEQADELERLAGIVAKLPVDMTDPQRPRLPTVQYGWVDLFDYAIIYRDDLDKMQALYAREQLQNELRKAAGDTRYKSAAEAARKEEGR